MRVFVQVTVGEFHGQCFATTSAYYLADTANLVRLPYAVAVNLPDGTERIYYAGQFQSV